MAVHIEKSWARVLATEFEKSYFTNLSDFVHDAYQKGTVYPKPKDIFRAFDLCPFDAVTVVILGQDPYHGTHQANGLAFSVNTGVALPPSLRNVYKEIADEYAVSLATVEKQGGDLSAWEKQGVLLLNATLTVAAHNPGSHQGRGWEEFTTAAIAALSENREHLVFLLWGNYAREKGSHIDRTKHLVLESAHPSPFSADRGFFGNGHFKKANEYLEEHSEQPIQWF